MIEEAAVLVSVFRFRWRPEPTRCDEAWLSLRAAAAAHAYPKAFAIVLHVVHGCQQSCLRLLVYACLRRQYPRSRRGNCDLPFAPDVLLEPTMYNHRTYRKTR